MGTGPSFGSEFPASGGSSPPSLAGFFIFIGRGGKLASVTVCAFSGVRAAIPV
jgi:hypothetical protein